MEWILALNLKELIGIFQVDKADKSIPIRRIERKDSMHRYTVMSFFKQFQEVHFGRKAYFRLVG